MPSVIVFDEVLGENYTPARFAEQLLATGRIIIVGRFAAMFCPNCGAKNSIEQNYCRGCGLKLQGVVEAVSEQFPSDEYASIQRRKERFQRVGAVCLGIAGVIGLSLLLFKAAQWKLELLGPDILFGSAAGALIGFLLLSVFFFNYTPGPARRKKYALPTDEGSGSPPVTAKLIEDRPFEHASVTEDTTEMLKVPRSAKR